MIPSHPDRTQPLSWPEETETAGSWPSPQLLECGAGYEEELAAEFAKAQEEKSDLENEDEELGGWSRDELSPGELFNRLAFRVGVICVLDEETLGGEEEDRPEMVPYDDRNCSRSGTMLTGRRCASAGGARLTLARKWP
jgi:hypothetical protein